MIVSNNQVQNVLKIYGKKAAEHVNKEKADAKEKKDAVVLSQEAKHFQNIEVKVKEKLAGTPDVRAEKVAELKQLVSSGQYKISNEQIAEKMLGRSIVDDVLKD